MAKVDNTVVGGLRSKTQTLAAELQEQGGLRPSLFANVFNGKVDDLDVENARYLRLETGIRVGHVPKKAQAKADAAAGKALQLWDALAAQVKAGDVTERGHAAFTKLTDDLGW